MNGKSVYEEDITDGCKSQDDIHSTNGNANLIVDHCGDEKCDKKSFQPKHISSPHGSPVSTVSRKGFFNKISGGIIWGLENSFFRVGYFVGEYPVLSIVVPIIMCCLCGLGMKTFEPSPDQEKLWVPSAARVINEKDWVDKTFPRETRFVSVLLIQKDNVLTPTVIRALMDVYQDSLKISVNGVRYPDMCVRLGPYCYVTSLLELWFYNKNVIDHLTEEDILNTINNTTVTPMSGIDVTTLLGGDITYDANGTIIGAEAAEITWIIKKENSDAEVFEKRMIQLAQKGHKDIDSTYVYATRSFDDEGYGAINSDTNLLTFGFSIVFVFVILSLGKFNLIQQKIYLSISGMLCVGLSVLVSYGVATALSIVYSPIQSILPFLLLGIGVDDMFVVVEAWKNLTPEEEELSIPNKIATTLSRAGVSITVTSITDIVAFGIGATTVIPALSSFCIYATIGILALFILVSTVFAGVLALDERRRRQRRDGCICCYVHPDSYTPNSCSQGRSLLQNFFTKLYGPLLTKKPVKVFIILLALTMTSVGFWRFIKMRKDFDLINYIPSDSYAYSYARTKEDYFHKEGTDATIFCGNFDYLKYAPNMGLMYDKLSKSKYIQPGTIVAWFTVFDQVTGGNFSSEAEYNKAVFNFVHSDVGSRFASFVKFNSTTEPVSIVATKFTLTHVLQSDSDGDVASMDNIRDIIDSCGFPTFNGDGLPTTECFAYAREYLTYETIKVLLGELYRNLGLAAAAVLIVTIILVANVRTSILVFICVLFTVIDVGGVLELWGTTIDTASSILLTLSVGLAVDYSAHVGHTFMTVQGNRDERSILTLTKIGPAVFNGGFSTFLAFVLLAKSASFGFQLFFRVFMSVVLFGIFHGLAFLPVLLSILGPSAYSYDDETAPESTLVVETRDKKQNSEQRPSCTEQNYSEFNYLGYSGPQNELYDKPDDLQQTRSPSKSPVPPPPALSSSSSSLHQTGVSSLQTEEKEEDKISVKPKEEKTGGVSGYNRNNDPVLHMSVIDVNKYHPGQNNEVVEAEALRRDNCDDDDSGSGLVAAGPTASHPDVEGEEEEEGGDDDDKIVANTQL